jgi:hypothetical protein
VSSVPVMVQTIEVVFVGKSELILQIKVHHILKMRSHLKSGQVAG